MLKRIKQNTLEAFKKAGIFEVVRGSRWRRQRLLILAYHGISLEDEHLWDPSLFLSLPDFRARLEILRDGGYSVLSLNEALRRLYSCSLPDRSVAITFDDGNYDFYKQAAPLLKEFDFPVTLYLTTYYSEYNKPVFNLICPYILWRARDSTLDLGKLLGDGPRLDLSAATARELALDLLHQYATRNHLSAVQKNDLAAGLARHLDVDYDELVARRILSLITPEEVAELSGQGVDIQMHTHRHRTPLDHKLFLREIEDNRTVIQRITSLPTSHFCYPSGDHKPEFLPWLREMNISSATTCDPGLATPQTDSLLLPRLVDSSHLSAIEFEGWLAGICSMLPRRPQLI